MKKTLYTLIKKLFKHLKIIIPDKNEYYYNSFTPLQKAKYSCDHPIPVLNITYTSSPPYGQYAKDCEKITLYYPHSLTIAPNQNITLRFPV